MTLISPDERFMPYDPHSRSALLFWMAESLNISPSLEKDARDKYHAVGNWLGAPGSSLETYDLHIFAQGSFALGTVVRPCTEGGEFDIDLVQIANLLPVALTSEAYRLLVGARLREHGTYSKILKENDRCWTLKYAGNFHLDVVPARPNQQKNPPLLSVQITNRKTQGWSESNPQGFEAWFKLQNAKVLQWLQERVAKSFSLSIDDVPEHKVRTPLQQTIQLLKRHRDLYFQNHQESCPASILLTTLAAQCHIGHQDLAECLEHILNTMNKGIHQFNDVWYVRNPSMPQENLARKWNENPAHKTRYDQWHAQAQKDFLSSYRDLQEYATSLKAALGDSVVQKSLQQYGRTASQSRAQQISHASLLTGLAVTPSAASILLKPHTFYGKK
ncbi:nucleotidyltransferase domain-containing protein [Deinococcus cellulosilyticus]|uniref:Nucleotidyltransferase n=1 Tax=Deinococcus cellulosilyticus (strain DSM 18568 / NBRC 106333 / KACC 11606 / 5516J-15) TaxID=1223518 RepID=A0A511NBR7_DEIC1|nr:nucleotidyltransferase [Deinococcus cellulosilyticus]GEM50037.1 nucleotidyltransferase [Deinococcus cellulosilyticus NBRC 106333 = KACC 11606]